MDTRVTPVKVSFKEQMLQAREDVVLLGEDMHDPYGGAFKVTAGLSSEWPERVLSTPISEAALVGCGIGLAMNGYRPIVEVMFADFLTLAIDQLYNHAVKFPALCPELTVPLVGSVSFVKPAPTGYVSSVRTSPVVIGVSKGVV